MMRVKDRQKDDAGKHALRKGLESAAGVRRIRPFVS
jgi:hypothetical protein